ncbi:hypothetical protein M427DRAFT_366957 [Gonapodya prolifera JEL478]|uniref:Methyltransferase domain-containing protein n=1 Tax=Gonapodya prolifera (strain JEL478) TaxID=1344416 RepID=A0A139A9D7_GONPJ|nr:hypothetical protein M427DRAFT_366957 [Gonapodya prolifera JEL478]|eukprot:KXS13441.1 hypothetical protein M427DRAFT_366957 [Gonapodya prolifera JEL478]
MKVPLPPPFYPPTIESLDRFLLASSTFVKRYRRVYCFRSNPLLREGWNGSDTFNEEDDPAHEGLPLSWKDALCDETLCTVEDLALLASLRQVKPSWPESLRQFVRELEDCSLIFTPRNRFQTAPETKWGTNSGLTPKKKIEVDALASIIEDVATSQDEMPTIVDFGCGQGYLTHRLAVDLVGCTVVGVDQDSNRNNATMSKELNLHYVKRKLETSADWNLILNEFSRDQSSILIVGLRKF